MGAAGGHVPAYRACGVSNIDDFERIIEMWQYCSDILSLVVRRKVELSVEAAWTSVNRLDSQNRENYAI
ncbi:hypothetical protein PN4B1_40050 [Paenibacillus naphthalenovorans]|nr:hypothetical protein PN4B1_40050 [Paenibacillus naphthalenovorans]